MINQEIFWHWVTVALYAVSSAIFLYVLNFNRERVLPWAVRMAGAGLLVHSFALGLRWWETGHGPYFRIYEVYSSTVWVVVLMFLLLQWKRPNVRMIGCFVMPAAFLMIGRGVMASPEIQPLPGNFKTYWLVVHILFAKISYGSMLLGTAFATLYLWKTAKRGGGRSGQQRLLQHLPEAAVLDELSYSLIGFGFFNLAIMIMAGSIWAHTAWGNYWSWDPVETWSLISWILYGIYLHLRRTYGWKGQAPAWLAMAFFVILLFSLFGIGVFYLSKHSPYISG